MASRFLLQIVDRETGAVVQLEPGLKAEKDLVAGVVARVQSLGVGFGRSSAHVAQDVQTALELELLDLKAQVKP